VAIGNSLGADGDVKKIDSICSINTLREQEAAELQKDSELTIVIGDRISSNANKLYEILKKSGEKRKQETVFVSNLKELLKTGLDLEKYHSALVVSSSSTPDFVEKELVDYLLKIGAV
jgi:4-hydroxy-3-methylbut-2-enyl diphosphate reductase